jgi:hypothetical protein
MTPTRTQWNDWTRRDPILAGLSYQDVRSQLRAGTQQRKDELLAALLRIARADPEAFGVLAACLLPGLLHRVARYARSLEREEALAILVAGLYERVAARAVDDDARFVAGRLLSLPTERLRRAVSAQRTWTAQARHDPETASRAGVVQLSAATLLVIAVDAGVIAEHDARLIFATRFAGRPLREAARRLGLRYETGKKRRQRAEARWAASGWTRESVKPLHGPPTSAAWMRARP